MSVELKEKLGQMRTLGIAFTGFEAVMHIYLFFYLVTHK